MNRVNNSLKALLAVGMMLAAQGAWAYVGPGTGLSAIGSFLAFLMAIVLVIVGFFWLPLKRLYKKWRGGPEVQSDAQAEQSVPAEPAAEAENSARE